MESPRDTMQSPRSTHGTSIRFNSDSLLALQQELASNVDPARLVGHYIDVEGMGIGRVVRFKKRSILNLTTDSTHEVSFMTEGQEEPQTQVLILRRRKLGSWNKGIKFILIEPPATPPASPPASPPAMP